VNEDEPASDQAAVVQADQAVVVQANQVHPTVAHQPPVHQADQGNLLFYPWQVIERDPCWRNH
jgi:hypothetical protein